MGGKCLKQKFPTSQGVQSVEIGIIILEALKDNENPMTLTELSKKLNMTKNRLKKYLVSFVRGGVLVFDNEHKTYRFGPKLIELGLNALNRLNIFSIIKPYMLQIKNKTSQSSALAIWTENGPIIAKYQRGNRPINVDIEVGYYPPLLGSAVGKCFAAFLPSQFTKELIDKEIITYDLDKRLVIEELNDIKEKEFSVRDSYFGDLPGNHSIACPIFDHSGMIIAAVCILGFTNDLDTSEQSYDVQTLKEVTRKISNQFAYQSNI